MKDFMIVGRGLAANVLAHHFNRQNISFTIIGNTNLSVSSKVAGGLWNPVVFKRMTKSWMADDLIPELLQFYSDCEKLFGTKIMYSRGIAKSFVELQEKKLWLKKSGEELSVFLDADIKNGSHPDLVHCRVEAEFGLVKQSGFIDVPGFLDESNRVFSEFIIDEIFDHRLLEIKTNCVAYKNNTAKNIIFCEGHLVKNNPYFQWIALKPAKGETFTIKANELELNETIFNRNGFILKLPSGNFKVGATYEWTDLNDLPSDKGENELRDKLNSLITCPYSVISHQAGIRPSSADRRPIIGPHPEFSNLFVFNGLGTKGVMLAPYFANNFVHFYLQNQEIVPDVHVKRFYPLYENWQKK
ncbi:MAG: FAD-dependent oxidoreductase [Bacteroidia bacterium]|nr:FAD-dependent oxidoreductase [Bacteroidia bacterium]